MPRVATKMLPKTPTRSLRELSVLGRYFELRHMQCLFWSHENNNEISSLFVSFILALM